MHATDNRQFRSLPDTGSRLIARVIRASQGQARLVETGGAEQAVTAHLDTVTPLAPGDQVLVEMLPDGVVVLGRLRRSGEPPALPVRQDDQGRLLIEHGEGVILRASGNAIELRADGAVLVNGRAIQAVAERQHRLQGATIELN